MTEETFSIDKVIVTRGKRELVGEWSVDTERKPSFQELMLMVSSKRIPRKMKKVLKKKFSSGDFYFDKLYGFMILTHNISLEKVLIDSYGK